MLFNFKIYKLNIGATLYTQKITSLGGEYIPNVDAGRTRSLPALLFRLSIVQYFKSVFSTSMYRQDKIHTNMHNRIR